MNKKNEVLRDSFTVAGSALDALEKWHHIPVLSAVLTFILWVRVQMWANFTQNSEAYFSGNDACYHFWEVMHMVQN
jgi:asparagine N-glycosylation enzyme membrane subunit Stt3